MQGVSTYSDDEWKRKLSATAYQALRKGVMEMPETGRYVHTQSDGFYVCAGCDTALFSSVAKVDDGSGYATFREPLDPGLVVSVTNYDENGNAMSGFCCASCGGRIGRLDAMTLQSAVDLEEGAVQRLYHASSHAIVMKKTYSPRNYPLVSILILLAVVVGGYFAWTWGMGLVHVAELERLDDSIPLWISDQEVRASVVRLDTPATSTAGMLVRQNSALFVVLGTNGSTPAIRFSNHSVDVLWLDAGFKVVGWERERASQNSTPLSRPSLARYAIIAQPGTLAPEAFASGFEIIVTNKSALF